MPSKRRAPEEVAVQARKKNKITNDNVQTNEAPRAEDTPAHSQSRSEAFGITEILEGILEYLPPRTLFQVQRVNKHFQATIASSLHLQQRMLLCIDNRPVTSWILPVPHDYRVKFVPKPRASDDAGRAVAPVVINPRLELLHYYDVETTAQRAGQTLGETLVFADRRRITLPQLEQLSSRIGYFCDPYCAKIYVTLCFHLGFRLPTIITVSRTFESTHPLTIRAIIRRTLDNSSNVRIRERCDGHILHSVRRLGIPRQLIAQMKQETGREVYFSPSDSTFMLFDTVAPTDEERAAVESMQNQG